MKTEQMRFQLLEAKTELDSLINTIDSGNLTECDDLRLALEFQQVFEHLCLAWHCRYKSASEINALSQEEFESLSKKVPNFACNFHME